MRRSEAIKQLQQEVLRLRDQGLSFGSIASQLGISKAYAVKLANTAADSSTSGSGRNDSRALTVRQRRFAVGLAEGQSYRQAAIAAGVPAGGADSYAYRTLRDEHFQESFREMLRRKGLDEERVAEVHSQNLQATKVVATATKDGKVTHIVERPDYPTRQRAVDCGWTILGRKKDDAIADQGRAVHFYLTEEDKNAIERVMGVTIPITKLPDGRCSAMLGGEIGRDEPGDSTAALEPDERRGRT